ncbi:peptidase [Rhodococcus sp. SRB_17]|nr:peptidase [Rhodococcus sp. SRB_17]
MSAPELERAPERASNDSSPPTKKPRSARPLILRLHFYAGILIGPFILIAALSGGLYAIAPSIEKIVYSDYLQTDSTGQIASLNNQIRSAQQYRPDLTVSAVRPATEPGETTRVLFTDPSLGESERLAVFVDPVMAKPVGELAVYGSSSSLPVRTWISQLHRNLHLGEPGRLYSELAASWMWVVALGGVYLWFRRYRTARNARLLTMDRTSTGRRRTLNWHGVVGIWIAVALVFLSATGLTWSTYAGENVTNLRTALSWTTPSVAKTLGDAPPPATGGHEGHGTAPAAAGMMTDTNVGRVDTVLGIARYHGITGPVEVSIPANAETAFTVTQTRQPWVFSNNTIAIDGATQKVTDELWFSDWPLAAKLSAWGIQLHMGLLFGLANQIALAALALALVSVVIRGYVMWWRRRPTRGSDWAVGSAPARGGICNLSPISIVALTALTALIGWFVPLLGISLLAFLLIDTSVAAFKRRATI